jgi:HJR/Mrr/RecB family endonuclease
MSPVVGSLPWTPEEEDFLRELALSGKYAAAIAVQMKRSEAAIRKRASG